MFFNFYNNNAVKIFLVLFITTLSGYGQWQLHSTVSREYNTNPFYMPEAQSSWITTTELGVGKNFEKVSIYYTGDYFLFDNLNERNFYWHQFVLSGIQNNFSWNINAEQRINREEDNLYDYSQFKTNFNYKFKIQKFYFFTNLNLGFINFPNMQELNSWNYAANFKVVKSFPTKTTLLSGINLNYKKYTNIFILPEETTENLNDINYLVSGGGSGGGGGRGGNGMFIQDETETPSVSIGKVWVRLAQSVFSKTGIAALLQKQFILSGNNRLLIGDVLNYQLEDLIFDDPMNYESDKFGAELTQILPWSSKFKSSYHITQKDYITQGIYIDSENYSDETKRTDDNKNLNFILTKHFNNLPGKNTYFTLSLQYIWLENISNSYWYNYKNEVTSLNMTLNF